ncbi:hypothetical protein IAD21_02270 [Abditibacteriota bacterium]|nr:hypothetical protein IAD21_02270 [Abditibacteriota bacterium]
MALRGNLKSGVEPQKSHPFQGRVPRSGGVAHTKSDFSDYLQHFKVNNLARFYAETLDC